ncbi:HNH endonuclease [Mycolicibacterium litorale]|uniref:HNH endonuclease n=1 Tax=Mycolicibacterium litorale TaxID=758802 RepID=UPI003CEAEC31
MIESPWEKAKIADLGTRTVEVPSRASWLLKADVKIEWLRWWIESFVPTDNTYSGTDELRRRAAVIRNASRVITAHLPLLDATERRNLVRLVTDIAVSIESSRTESRTPLNNSLKRALLDSSGIEPRCYLCGGRFSAQAVDRFLGNAENPLLSSPIVDFVFPRGARSRDASIVVDHVRPVRAGGSPTDLRNLRLACDFCNSFKSDSLTIYSRGHYAKPFSHPTLGNVFPPNPFWVVRILAMDGRCASCGRNSVEAQLFAATREQSKYMNPVALELYCRDHDPLVDSRWVKARSLPSINVGTS